MACPLNYKQTLIEIDDLKFTIYYQHRTHQYYHVISDSPHFEDILMTTEFKLFIGTVPDKFLDDKGVSILTQFQKQLIEEISLQIFKDEGDVIARRN